MLKTPLVFLCLFSLLWCRLQAQEEGTKLASPLPPSAGLYHFARDLVTTQHISYQTDRISISILNSDVAEDLDPFALLTGSAFSTSF
jgi:hypothetical protein